MQAADGSTRRHPRALRAPTRAALALTFALALGACRTTQPADPTDPTDPGPLVVQPYWAQGRVTDARGNPVEGAEVHASNALSGAMTRFDHSDEDGRYRIALDDVTPSSWYVGGFVDVEYGGVEFSYPLHVDSLERFTSEAGAVRHLRWLMSGRAPDGSYYGGRAEVRDGSLEGPYVPDMSRVELTFEPQRPLLDGSEGETVVVFLDAFRVESLPLTAYLVTARYVPEAGEPFDLLIRTRGQGSYDWWEDADFTMLGTAPVMELEVMVPLP